MAVEVQIKKQHILKITNRDGAVYEFKILAENEEEAKKIAVSQLKEVIEQLSTAS